MCRDHASHKIQQENLPFTVETMIKIFTDLYIKEYKLDEASTIESTSTSIPNAASKGYKSGSGPAKQLPVKADVRTLSEVNDEQAHRPLVKKVNKTLTLKTRREVFKRDKCCQFKNKDTGEICGETAFPQVDHKISQWAGGTHELENLQQLCANHNRRKYRKEAQLSWL
ncbi:hypothetical protein D3C87_1565970 [compost metagenome]